MEINLISAEDKRRHIKILFLEKFNIKNLNSIEIMSENKVNFLIKSYDDMFFNNYIKRKINKPIKISFSNRMTSSGGKTIYINKGGIESFEIRLSNKVLSTFTVSSKKKNICGIEAFDLVDGLMLVLEHELCHVLEFSLYGNSNCKGTRFKLMAGKLYNHVSSYHEILNVDNESEDEVNFKIGQTVVFTHQGERYEGIISRINKRATVMVKNRYGNYKDSHGIKYSKWYVPTSRLIIKESNYD